MVPYDSFVARTVDQILAEARKLPEEDRKLIAAELERADDEPEEVRKAWFEEIERRIESIKRGEAVVHDAEAVYHELRKELGY
jgi:CHASE3 domain sensor protein